LHYLIINNFEKAMIKFLKHSQKKNITSGLFFLITFIFSLITFETVNLAFEQRFSLPGNEDLTKVVSLDMVHLQIIAQGEAILPSVQTNLYGKKISALEDPNKAFDIFQARDFASNESIQKARAHLQYRLEQIPVDSRQTIQSFLSLNPQSNIAYTIFLNEYDLMDQVFKGNTVTSKIRLNLNGNKKIGLPEQKGIFGIFLTFKSEKTDKETEKLINFEREIAADPYTGLIVDLRGKKIIPALFPRIYDESGLIIYDYRSIHKNILIKKGVVLFTNQRKNLKLQHWVGVNPYYVAAMAVVGENFKTDPVILRKHTLRILGHPQTRKSLKNGKVAFLID
jgi:hypothetical protein